MSQSTNNILMIRPSHFYKNEQTSVNNYYQQSMNLSDDEVHRLALSEFDHLVDVLREHGVNVVVIQDTPEPKTPDSIFPNNWISFHAEETIALYPMFAENRRLERREEIVEQIDNLGFNVGYYYDFSIYEEEDIFLEGTGSMVLDRVNKLAYCALSERADESLLLEFCKKFDYTPVVFTANQTVNNERKAIYHTNVMMSVTTDFVMICLDAIDNPTERENVIQTIEKTNKEIIDLKEEQLGHLVGNVLEVVGRDGKMLCMSTQAYKALEPSQKESIEKYTPILHAPIPTIETCGGGGVRCMMAEMFLEKTKPSKTLSL